MWGLIWHFSATHVMSQGLKPLATHADYIVKDSLRYLNNTHKQVSTAQQPIGITADYVRRASCPRTKHT
jgi:hypothetical protein